MSQVKALEKLYKVQNDEVAQVYARFNDGFPAAFVKAQSELELTTMLQLAENIDGCGLQRRKLGDCTILVYQKSCCCNPVEVAKKYEKAARVEIAEGAWKDGATLVVEKLYDAPAAPVKAKFTAKQLKVKGVAAAELACAVTAIDWKEVADLDAAALAKILPAVCEVRKRDYSLVAVDKVAGGYAVTVSVSAVATSQGYLANLLKTLAAAGAQIAAYTVRNVTVAGNVNEFDKKAVRVYTFQVKGAIAAKALAALPRELNELCWGAQFDLFESELADQNQFTEAQVNFVRAAAAFVQSQLAYVDRNAYTYAEIQRYMATYPEILKQVVAAFEAKFCPKAPKANISKELAAIQKAIAEINSGYGEKDAKVRVVFNCVANFLATIIKSNYYSEKKCAISFGVDPSFMDFYSGLSEKYRPSFPMDAPFGVFFFWHKNSYGYQIRFAEIGRGGWRTVFPRASKNPLEKNDAYDQARNELFRECFVLANTQHKKNKDIYEGGSKLTTLFNFKNEYDFKTELWASQRPVIEAFLQLINYDAKGKLKDKNLVDYTGRVDIIEVGPDENMFDDMISWMGNRAEEEGYTLKSGFISGKVDTGINHKHYGVTSFGVFQYFLRTLEHLKINIKDDFSVKLSGGPFGDVAGNMVKLLNQKDAKGKFLLPKLRIIAVTDGPAAVYDPAGMDRNELSSLVHKANLDSFRPEKLKGEGAFMIFNKPDANDQYPMATIKNKKLVKTTISRNEFMKLFQNNICHQADVFIPCGGRPQTINIGNYKSYLINGVPSSRAIVEGANSFITPEARVELQKLGIVVIRDASSNKCGVITSSYEILSGILLSVPEFQAIREKLVGEIMERLKNYACQEANWLYDEFYRRGNVLMTELSDELADKINMYKHDIGQMLLSHPELVTNNVIERILPPILKSKKFASRINQLPESYRRAIVAVEAAAEIVYRKTLSLEEEVAAIAARKN